MLAALFWNPTENRLRLFWRLVGLVVLTVPCLILFEALFENILDIQNPLYPSACGITLGIVLAARLIDRRPFSGFGFQVDRSWWHDAAFGLLLGLILQAGIFGATFGMGWVEIVQTFQPAQAGQPFAIGLAWTVAYFAVVAFWEELAFRGYLLQNFSEGFQVKWLTPTQAMIIAWVFSSILFGLGHAANPNASVMSTANIVLAGLLLGLGYVLTNQLALPIALHFSWNLAEGNLFGFPVSGAPPEIPAQVLVLSHHGPVVWTGGAFGPEAGLTGTIAMLIGMGAIWMWVHHMPRRSTPETTRIAMR